MLGKLFRAWVATVSWIGADARDDEDLRTRKRVLVLGEIYGDIPSSVLQGTLYCLIGPVDAGLLLLLWAGLCLLNLVWFAIRRHNFRPSAARALLLGAVMPIPVTAALGGIINSGFFVIITLAVPLGALLLFGTRAVPGWTLLQFASIAVLGAAEPYLHEPVNGPLTPVLISTLFNLSFASLLNIVVFCYFVSQRNRALALLKEEQAKTELLLLNILPRDIAGVLKGGNRLIADHFDTASVLFADMVNFTPLSTELTPQQLVLLLNEVFSHIDTLVEKYGVEKIKTIGDCYMVAAGIPRPRPDHAQALARLALDIRDYGVRHVLPDGRRLTFRIGLNSGPVVAGVIGRKKFIYDLWGDAVNTASRMESHGAGGVIQLTRATFNLIEEAFHCQSQPPIMVKGKGEMEVWHLVGPRGPTMAEAAAQVTEGGNRLEDS